MSVDGVAQLLLAIEDDGVRERVVRGDLSDVEGIELSDEERDLVVAAAGDDGEVTGFDMHGSPSTNAIAYVTQNLHQLAPTFHAQFSDFAAGRTQSDALDNTAPRSEPGPG